MHLRTPPSRPASSSWREQASSWARRRCRHSLALLPLLGAPLRAALLLAPFRLSAQKLRSLASHGLSTERSNALEIIAQMTQFAHKFMKGPHRKAFEVIWAAASCSSLILYKVGHENLLVIKGNKGR